MEHSRAPTLPVRAKLERRLRATSISAYRPVVLVVSPIFFRPPPCASDARRAGPDPRLAQFAERLTFIDQLREHVAPLKVRRERYRAPRLRADVKAEIKAKTKKRKLQVAALIKTPDLARRFDLLLSIERLGATASLMLVPTVTDEAPRNAQEFRVRLTSTSAIMDRPPSCSRLAHGAGG